MNYKKCGILKITKKNNLKEKKENLEIKINKNTKILIPIVNNYKYMGIKISNNQL